MWQELEPDTCQDVTVDGYTVKTYSFGEGDDVIFCLNGGPGLPCDYLRDSHSCLKFEGYRVVAFDQLGTGLSDRPDDESLWTIERYVAEVETVRQTLGLGKVHTTGSILGRVVGNRLCPDPSGCYSVVNSGKHRSGYSSSCVRTGAIAGSSGLGDRFDDAAT